MIVDTGDNLDQEIIINRSPMAFEHVFAYVVDQKHSVPGEYLYELDFYGVDYKKNYPDVKSILEEIGRLKVCLIDIRQQQNVISTCNWSCFGANCNKLTEYNNTFFCKACKHQCYTKTCNKVPESNYCKEDLSNGIYCDKLSCINRRVKGSTFCYEHYK